MQTSATTTAPRTEMGTTSSLYAHTPLHRRHWWEPPHRSLDEFDTCPSFDSAPAETGHRLLRFFTHFSGPIIWTVEIAAALVIVATHSLDIVGVVIIANLVMILGMMGFRASLGLWQASHPSSTIDILERRHAHRAGLHLR